MKVTAKISGLRIVNPGTRFARPVKLRAKQKPIIKATASGEWATDTDGVLYFKARPVAIYHTEEEADRNIDVQKGLIRGVSVITQCEAKGHDLVVDRTTLEEMLALARANPAGVKVKQNHKTGVEAIFGKLTNFYIEGEQLKADLQLIQEHQNYAQILSQIRQLPTLIGLSASFAPKPNQPKNAAGKSLARVQELLSVDLVENPAANPGGMFSTKRVDTRFFNMPSRTTNKLAPASHTDEDVEAADALAALQEQVDELREHAQEQADEIAVLRGEGEDTGDSEDSNDDDDTGTEDSDDDDTEGDDDEAYDDGYGADEPHAVTSGRFSRGKRGSKAEQMAAQALHEVRNFQSQVETVGKRKIDLEQAEIIDTHITNLEATLGYLTTELEERDAEIDALRTELSRRPQVQLSISSAEAIGKTDFGAMVESEKESAKALGRPISHGEAITLAARNYPEKHQEYLESLGMGFKRV